MKAILFLLLATTASYAQTDDQAIHKCLKAWKNSPFKKSSPYKTIMTNVKVFGIGNNTEDSEATKEPSLVLVKPSVNVLGKTIFNLLNPNAWYCFKSSVTVLGKTQINIDCNAKMANSSTGVNVLGKREKSQGVVVLGAMTIKQVGCPKK